MSPSAKKNKNNILELYFVHKDDRNPTTSTEDMQIAFRACTEHFGSNRTVKWISENDCEKFNIEDITNKNIFVFSEFSGSVFSHLEASTKAVILGPRCLISCFNENVEIPTSNSPVYTLPMRKLFMTASGLTVQEKEAIRRKVSYMGGLYLDDLNDICTHLVTKTIGSVKYEIAASKNMCIMHPDWVPEVWKQSQTRYILATDIEFHKFKLPCFHSLNITSTGLTGRTLESIKTLVNKNGGTYSGVFQSENTDILLLEQRSVTSEKFKAAVRFKKLCLSPQWIFDSIDKGFSVPYRNYTISSLKVSTPTKSGVVHSSDFNPDSTALSEISYLEDRPISLSETMVNTLTRLSSNEGLHPNNEKSYKQFFNEIDMVHTRKSGFFLDGCNIFLSGFTNDEKDKLNKILNMGGATRFEELNEKVTHVLIGDIIQADFKFLQENKLLPYIIKMSWLLESIKLKQPASEEAHKISEKINSSNVKTVAPSNPSPATKKTIQSMNYSFKRPAIPKFRLDEKLKENPVENIELEKNISKLLPPLKHEDDLVSQYLEGNNKNELTLKPLQPTTATTNEHTTFDTCEYSENYTIKNFLEGCHCYIYGFSDVYCEQMIQDCEKACATVVGDTYKDEVDFLITPSERIERIDAPVTARNIVNDLWLDESIRLNERANASHYYFRPIVFEGNEQPLLNEAVVVSIYSSAERSYLVNVAQSLGANVNDKYIKAAQPILICPKPEGAKYEGAIKWGNAVLTAEWLCNCLKEKRRINEIPYLVGDSIPSKKNKIDEIINEESSELNRKNTAEDDVKENNPHVVKEVLDEDNFITRPKRVRELATEKSSPKTPTATLSISDVVKFVPTPHRALLYDTLKAMEETPNTKKFRKLIATPVGKNGEIPETKTPEMPDCLRTEVTPYGFRPDASPRNHEMHKRRFQVLDMYYQPISDSKRRKSLTPLSEVKRRFWKNAFGDEYDSSPSIDNDEKPSTSRQSRRENNLDVTNSISRMNCLDDDSIVDENSANKSGSNENVKRLSDFISKSREQTSKNIKLERARHISEDHNDEEKSNLVRIDTQLLDLDTEQNNKDVDWRDPDDFFQSQRFQNKSQTKKIVLCSISNISPDSRRDDIIAKIIQLGGEVLDHVFDDKTTHIFCDKLNRGEKILSAIASGKWILSSKYVEDSAESQEFLNEELYQWGNPNAKSLPELGAMDHSIAKASFNWRRKILANTGKMKGAFTGFRIILHHTNKSSFHRLLKVGDGQVIDAREPYRNSEAAKTATHCIVETRKLTLSAEDHKALIKAGVMVLNITFLNAYLTQENLPDPKDFMLPI